MSFTFYVSDEQYQAIAHAAAQKHLTPEAYFLEWAESVKKLYQPLNDKVFTEDEFLQALGMNEEDIAQAESLRQRLYGGDDADI